RKGADPLAARAGGQDRGDQIRGRSQAVSGAVKGIAIALLALFSGSAPARQIRSSPLEQVRALAEAGRLAEAERLARGGGAALSVALGDVLALEGRLSAADSVFAAAVRGKLPAARSASAGLAELAARRGDRANAKRLAEALTTAFESDGARWPVEDKTAAG